VARVGRRVSGLRTGVSAVLTAFSFEGILHGDRLAEGLQATGTFTLGSDQMRYRRGTTKVY
jgi:hypothetical protein